jgi:hypothetical protein
MRDIEHADKLEPTFNNPRIDKVEPISPVLSALHVALPSKARCVLKACPMVLRDLRLMLEAAIGVSNSDNLHTFEGRYPRTEQLLDMLPALRIETVEPMRSMSIIDSPPRYTEDIIL